MTDRLHQDLVSLADRAPVAPLDLPAVRLAVAARRRRRHLATLAALASGALLVVPVAHSARSHYQGQNATLLAAPVATLTPPMPAPGSPFVPAGYLRAESTDPQVQRLLQIADQQASPARAITVYALRTNRAMYLQLTGTDPGPYTPTDAWLLQISGDTTHCAPACFGGTRSPQGTYLTLLIDAATYNLAGYGLSPSALPLPTGPDGALLLRG